MSLACFYLLNATESLTISASISSIRNRLTALKKDRGEFVKAHDVLSLYHAVVKQGKPTTTVMIFDFSYHLTK